MDVLCGLHLGIDVRGAELFIAVVVRAMEQQVAADMEANVAERQREDAVTTAAILDEVRALRLELAELRRNANP